MTFTLALDHLVLAASSKSSANPILTFLPLIAIGLLAYFFFIRPQQRKAQAARETQGSGYEVGDEVQTVGGVIGTVLEIHGDRYTLLTGALGDDGNLDGPQPTRIVFVRQAIARKIDRIEDVTEDVRKAGEPDDASDHGDAAGTGGGTTGTTGTNGTGGTGGTGAEHDGEANDA